MNVASDPEKTAAKLKGVLDAYNDIVAYSAQNNIIQREQKGTAIVNSFGTLAKTNVDDSLLSSVRGVISSVTSGLPGAVQTMADIGVTIQGQTVQGQGGANGSLGGTYNFNVSQTGPGKFSFNDALARDQVGVEKILNNMADALASNVSGVIKGYTQLNGAFDIRKQSNDSEDKTLNETIDRINRSIDKQEETLRKVFTNLEKTIGKLNGNASAITSILNAPTPNR